MTRSCKIVKIYRPGILIFLFALNKMCVNKNRESNLLSLFKKTFYVYLFLMMLFEQVQY